MDIAKKFGRDMDKVENGVEISLGDDGTWHKVRHISSAAVRNIVDALNEDEKALWEASDLDGPEGRRVLAKVVAKAGLVAWSNNFEVGGKVLEFSDENAFNLLNHEAMQEYLAKVVGDMITGENFGLDTFEMNAKN